VERFAFREHIHREANNHYAQEAEDEGTSLSHAVRDVGEDDCKDGSGDIDGDSHELRGTGRISQVSNDARQEQADTVERTHNLCDSLVPTFLARSGILNTHSPVNKDVDPNLPVLESLHDISPREALGLRNLRPSHATGVALSIGGSIRPERLSLVLEAENDKVTFLLGKKSGRLGEIVQ
jgi:hypothetical protein